MSSFILISKIISSHKSFLYSYHASMDPRSDFNDHPEKKNYTFRHKFPSFLVAFAFFNAFTRFLRPVNFVRRSMENNNQNNQRVKRPNKI